MTVVVDHVFLRLWLGGLGTGKTPGGSGWSSSDRGELGDFLPRMLSIGLRTTIPVCNSSGGFSGHPDNRNLCTRDSMGSLLVHSLIFAAQMQVVER